MIAGDTYGGTSGPGASAYIPAITSGGQFVPVASANLPAGYAGWQLPGYTGVANNGAVVTQLTNNGYYATMLYQAGTTGTLGGGWTDLGAEYLGGSVSSPSFSNQNYPMCINPGVNSGNTPLYVGGVYNGELGMVLNATTGQVTNLYHPGSNSDTNGSFVFADAVNDYGWAVGEGFTHSGGGDDAVLYYTDSTGAGHWVDLTTLIAGMPGGSNWQTTPNGSYSNVWCATGITDYIPSIGGEIITGYGRLTGGSTEEGWAAVVDIAPPVQTGNPGQVIVSDPVVDVNDLTVVLTNFGRTGQTWSQGAWTATPRARWTSTT